MKLMKRREGSYMFDAIKRLSLLLLVALFFYVAEASYLNASEKDRWGTASLVVIVERNSGSVLVVDSKDHRFLGRIERLGNLTHATVKFSKDARYAYVIGREAEVSKIDLLKLRLVKKVKAGLNSVGGVMTQDGRYLALSNYAPGEVRILDAETLEEVKRIPAIRRYPDGTERMSRVVGLLDLPGNLLIFSLMDVDGIWVVDAGRPDFPVIKKFWDAGKTPYDALLTPDGRYYIVGFLESNWMGLIDTWAIDEGVKRILTDDETTKGKDVPLWKIPHLKGWAIAGNLAFLPALKREWAIVYNIENWNLIRYIPLEGTALYTVTSPDGRRVWVDLIGKNGDLVQVIDTQSLEVIKTLNPGKGATHPQFTAKGEAVYISLMDDKKVVVYDAYSLERIKEFPAENPSGIFFAYRANRFGM